jgi:hypothetical protein
MVKISSQDNENKKTNNVELTMPTFIGKINEHPKQFLKKSKLISTSQTDYTGRPNNHNQKLHEREGCKMV